MTTNKEPKGVRVSLWLVTWILPVIDWTGFLELEIRSSKNHARNDEELLPNHVKGSRQGLKKSNLNQTFQRDQRRSPPSSLQLQAQSK